MVNFKVSRVSEYEVGEGKTMKELTLVEHPAPDSASGRSPISFAFSTTEPSQQAIFTLGSFHTLAPKAAAPKGAEQQQSDT